MAPERALVFVTAGSVQNFARVAADVGLEVFAEMGLEDPAEIPEGFEPPGKATSLPRTLYATMPTLESLRQILSLWNAHQAGESAPSGAAPWWSVFDMLLEIRPWGPEDRLTEDAKEVIRNRLPLDDDEQIAIEFEIWPTVDADRRAAWRFQTEQRILEAGGEVLDRSTIAEDGFTYEALLAGLPTRVARLMLDDPGDLTGLVTLDGVQFILPQMIGQAPPGDVSGESGQSGRLDAFSTDAPIRAALLDGTPAAAHSALDGGVVVEDIHDLVRLSPVDKRYHATAMASLILRGDLETDGSPLGDTRLVSVPLLVDSDEGAWTPGGRLFVDLVHTALMRLISGTDPVASDVFVVNFSIGVPELRFAGRISSLARLMDWWSAKEGVLFVVSAGNIADGLDLVGVGAAEFEDADHDERVDRVRGALRSAAYDRTLLAPAEALNGLAVGALSRDLSAHSPPHQAGIMMLEGDEELKPQMTSALGLGLHRAIKPDLLEAGGLQEVRVYPNGRDAVLRPVDPSQRTGLVAASPRVGADSTQRSRGTSPAAALVTRSVLQSAEVLTGTGGPYEGQELRRRQLALLTRALAVNSARWPKSARDLYNDELAQLGPGQSFRAKEEVCRYFGYGTLNSELMQRSPDAGVTLVGVGSIRKDGAQIFELPLPPSMSGDRVPRSMRATLAWFTPTNVARAQYRLAGLEAVAADDMDEEEDKRWALDMKSEGPDVRTVKRGSVWSRRLVNRIKAVPTFDDGATLSICVQCRDTASGGLSPDHDVEFAIAVTLEIEAEVLYDIHEEVEQEVRIRIRRRG